MLIKNWENIQRETAELKNVLSGNMIMVLVDYIELSNRTTQTKSYIKISKLKKIEKNENAGKNMSNSWCKF